VPLGRYFLFVGSLLVAMLFFADWYWPIPVSQPSFQDGLADKSIMRINSAHRWPEAIVLDTSVPTMVAPPTLFADQTPDRSRESFSPAVEQPMPEKTRPVKAKRRFASRLRASRVAAYHPVTGPPSEAW
jgi:hypothetical protein